MKLRDFIKENRQAIDDVIKKECPNVGPINDEERRLWILNLECLYNWARSQGVRI